MALPIRDIERALQLVGEKETIRLLASLVDAKEIAALWGTSEDFVEDLGRRGRLRRVKMGRLVKYRLLDVLKFADAQSTQKTADLPLDT